MAIEEQLCETDLTISGSSSRLFIYLSSFSNLTGSKSSISIRIIALSNVLLLNFLSVFHSSLQPKTQHNASATKTILFEGRL